MKQFWMALFICCSLSAAAQDFSRFEKKTHTGKDGAVLPYRILFPDNYDQSKKYPLVLFLHGAGERGSDNEKQLVHGAKTFLNQQAAFPCIVIAPQCPAESYWASVKIDRSNYPLEMDFNYQYEQTRPLSLATELVREVMNKEAVDKDRVYITGLSMGGMGTIEAVYRNPGLFAAAVPVCGGGDATSYTKRHSRTPFWIFHGDEDGVVKVEYSRELYARLRQLETDVTYTEYEGVNHNSWDYAYEEEKLLPWLFAKKNGGGRLPLISGENRAIVETNYGKVRGYVHNGIYSYKGIPYAKAERFMPPQEPDGWEGVRSSMTYGPVCPLLNPVTQVSDQGEFPFHHDWGYPNEDCLRLNIWTPGINDGKKRPVMLWFHGGGYYAGSSQELPSYDGASISRKGDVVLISINHRLNVLGYLDLSAYGEKYRSSANVGMMDLEASLRWIKGNIANFGGDPDNVTIFGQSGGGGKVTTMMNAPSAKGFFHKAIVQSGVGVKFQDPKLSRRVGAAVLDALDIKAAEVDKLQKVPLDQLMAAAQTALQKVNIELASEGAELGLFGVNWEPVLDGAYLPYQTGTPEALALSKDIPLMIGSTKNEFITSLWRDPTLLHADPAAIDTYLKDKYGEKKDAYLAAVKKAYPDDRKATDLVDVDILFRQAMVAQANEKAANGTAPVYLYLFTWQSPAFDGQYKALHCMELPFVFNNIARCEEMTGGGYEAYELADKMSQSWINFARSGNPQHEGLPQWPSYNSENGACLLFDNECTVKQHHDRELLKVAADAPGNQW